MMTGLYLALLGAVGLQRLFELRLCRANRRASGDTRLLRHGTLFLIVHTSLVVLPALEVLLRATPPSPVVFAIGAGLAVAAQALRLWTMRALGRGWTTATWRLPGTPWVTSGPYRWMRHPCYLAVVVEFTALPLAGEAWMSWLVLNLLHTPLLLQRIREEEAFSNTCDPVLGP